MNHETLYYVHQHVWPTAMSMLPGQMNTPEAEAEILAIGLQESGFAARVQGGGGPAHGYWQFEGKAKQALDGVLRNTGTLAKLTPVLHTLNYGAGRTQLYNAIVDNDVLACCIARLNLWLVPGRLPRRNEPNLAYQQYISGWEPGRPHPKDWPGNFTEAWKIILCG